MKFTSLELAKTGACTNHRTNHKNGNETPSLPDRVSCEAKEASAGREAEDSRCLGSDDCSGGDGARKRGFLNGTTKLVILWSTEAIGNKYIITSCSIFRVDIFDHSPYLMP